MFDFFDETKQNAYLCSRKTQIAQFSYRTPIFLFLPSAYIGKSDDKEASNTHQLPIIYTFITF